MHNQNPSTNRGGGVRRRKKTPTTVKKIWNPKRRLWNYEVVDKETWKPNLETLSRKELEQRLSKDVFSDEQIVSLEEVTKWKDEAKSKYDDYENINDFKRHIYLKRYSHFVAIELLFFHFIKLYPLKEIFYCIEKLEDIFNDEPTLDRLRYRKRIELPDSIEKISSVDYGIVNFWVFEDSVIFKN